MVYANFPQKLTEEEELLLKKYAKLKKKKKTVNASRVQKAEPKQETTDSKKRPAEAAADATVQAKKLLKLGAIKVENEKKDQTTFKRTKRQKDSGEKSAVTFQPFSPTFSGEAEEETKSEHVPVRPRMKSLHESFISSRDRLEPGRPGNTIYVSGQGINELFLRETFSTFGRILNISMERGRGVGFVTFEKHECASQAIKERNDSLVSDVLLRVSMARRQPIVDVTTTTLPAGGSAGQDMWRPLSESSGQKSSGSHQDTRELVSYDDQDQMFDS